jgi:hypothetical protein
VCRGVGRSADGEQGRRVLAIERRSTAAFDTLNVQLVDGATLRGPLISTTAGDMLIPRTRAFRRGIEQRVRFDTVKELSRTHPTRDKVITIGVVGVLGSFLATALMLAAAG